MLKSSDFHKDFSNFRILIHEINERGLSLELNLKQNALNELIKEPNQPFSWTSKEDHLINFTLARENDETFIVKAEGLFKLIYPCQMCLEPLEHSIKVGFFLRMMQGNTDEQALLDADILVAYFTNNTIDLGIILREQIFLSLPDFPKCGNELSITKRPCQMDLTKAFNETVLIKENPFVKHFKK